MSWEYKKAISRIYNTFKRLNKQIYAEDIEALKILNEFIDEKDKEYVNSNLVYAKLLCIFLRQNLNYYGNIKAAVDSLNDQLKNPLKYNLELLTLEINSSELGSYLESIGIDNSKNHFPDSEKSKIEKDIISQNQKDIIEKLNKFWALENVEKSFYNTANQILKDINNYS